MSDNLFLGAVLGFMVGALIVHRNEKASELIENGKEKVKEAIDKI